MSLGFKIIEIARSDKLVRSGTRAGLVARARSATMPRLLERATAFAAGHSDSISAFFLNHNATALLIPHALNSSQTNSVSTMLNPKDMP